MTVDLDTFLTAVYTAVDTLYQTAIAPQLPVRRGRKPRMHDSEVLTLLLVGQWRGSSERALLRWAADQLRAYFPVLLSQSAFNRRVRALGPVLVRLLRALASVLGAAQSPYQVVDTVPVPLARRCRGRRHRLFAAEAAHGRGGADRQRYYGCALLLATSAEGAITGFVLGPASTQERWLLDALLTWRVHPAAVPWTAADPPPSHAKGGGYVGPTGPRWWPDSAGAWSPGPYLADRGFAGAAWQAHWQTDLGATVLPPPRGPAARQQAARRQVIESVNALLIDVLHLAYPRAKTMWGVVCRVAAKCAAINVGLWCNWQLGRPDLALATLFAG